MTPDTSGTQQPTNKALFGQLNSESPGDLLQLIILQQTESVASV